MINDNYLAELDNILARMGKGDKFNDIDTVPHKKKKYWAIVVKVLDGDTIKIVSNINNEFFKINIRIFGIDAPELHSKNPLERQAAEKVKKILAELILGKKVIVENLALDKYGGRLIANVFIDGCNCAEYLQSRSVVKPYFGKTKEKWLDGELTKILGSK